MRTERYLVIGKALKEMQEKREPCFMPKHESDSRAGREADEETISLASADPGRPNIFEMSWFQTGLIIDNGGGEVSALND